jgi:hypothetical protein
MDFNFSVVADEPKFSKFVHEKTNAGPGGAPIISANVSWLILGLIGRGLPSFPKFASRRRSCASRFSLELNNWSIKSSSIRLHAKA